MRNLIHPHRLRLRTASRRPAGEAVYAAHLPANLLELILQALLDEDHLRAGVLAERGADGVLLPTAERSIYHALAAYAYAYQVWYQSWDYGEVVLEIERAIQRLPLHSDTPWAVVLEAFFKAEHAAIECEQAWMCGSVKTALGQSRDGLNLFDQAALHAGNLGAHPVEAGIFLRLMTRRKLYLQGVHQYLEAYARCLRPDPDWRTAVEAGCQELDNLYQQLCALDGWTEGREIHAYRVSLQRCLDTPQVIDSPLRLQGTRFTWTYRVSFPRGVVQNLLAAVAENERGAPERGRRTTIPLENLAAIPMLGAGRSYLNDVFQEQIGEENFVYLSCFFPDFTINVEPFSHPLRVTPVLRLYALGIAALHFLVRDAAADRLEDCTLAQVQQMRLFGLLHSPGLHFRVDWLPPHEFKSLPQAAGAILQGLRPVFEHYCPAAERPELEAIVLPAASMPDRSEDGRWTAYELIQVPQFSAPAAALHSVYEAGLAALSQPIPESIDSLNSWLRCRYEPQEKLARKLRSLDDGEYFFVSSDHVFMHMPGLPEWVQNEYLDLVEFNLNILTATNYHLQAIDREIAAMGAVGRRLEGIEGSPEQIRQFARERLASIARVNDLKAGLLVMRNLARAARITQFEEHRALLERSAEAINLEGAIAHAEHLSAALLGIEQDWDSIGRLLYQEKTALAEERRARFEGVLTLMLQVIGIAQIVSSVISIVVLGEQDTIIIPWWFNAENSLVVSGRDVKVWSLWMLLAGVLLILLAWQLATRKDREG